MLASLQHARVHMPSIVAECAMSTMVELLRPLATYTCESSVATLHRSMILAIFLSLSIYLSLSLSLALLHFAWLQCLLRQLWLAGGMHMLMVCLCSCFEVCGCYSMSHDCMAIGTCESMSGNVSLCS